MEHYLFSCFFDSFAHLCDVTSTMQNGCLFYHLDVFQDKNCLENIIRPFEQCQGWIGPKMSLRHKNSVKNEIELIFQKVKNLAKMWWCNFGKCLLILHSIFFQRTHCKHMYKSSSFMHSCDSKLNLQPPYPDRFGIGADRATQYHVRPYVIVF